MRLILGSGSPRRKEILSMIGCSFDIVVSGNEEIPHGDTPEEIVQNLASDKAQSVAGMVAGDVRILGADTIVVNKGDILGKPKDREDAVRMLKALSGHEHYVCTGVAILTRIDGRLSMKTFCEKTFVYVASLTPEEIEEYVDTGEPMDKAGAYGIQGKFGKFIDKIDGDYYNVVGLPAARVYRALKES